LVGNAKKFWLTEYGKIYRAESLIRSMKLYAHVNSRWPRQARAHCLRFANATLQQCPAIS